jgi:hypothetical protein
LCDVAFFPHLETGFRRWRINLGAGSRVFGDHGQFDGGLGDGAQGFQKTFGGVWRVHFLCQESLDILRFHPGERQATTIHSLFGSLAGNPAESAEHRLHILAGARLAESRPSEIAVTPLHPGGQALKKSMVRKPWGRSL